MEGYSPASWVREWINDDCGCGAVAKYSWDRVPGPSETWVPTLDTFHFQRSLFCGFDHRSEVERWRALLDSDSASALTRLEVFALQGNSEGG